MFDLSLDGVRGINQDMSDKSGYGHIGIYPVLAEMQSIDPPAIPGG
ncbi:hypothetical protein [Thalassobacillus pellis]|nr:hypothetical protein [Thalassobacillus pellis]MBM7554537.1 hypothetical protein [Thalassobacillus pellis]